jgi:hypothetical protein
MFVLHKGWKSPAQRGSTLESAPAIFAVKPRQAWASSDINAALHSYCERMMEFS